MVERMRTEAHPSRGWKALDEAEASDHLKIPEGKGSGNTTAPFGE
jgi:cytochrome c oxidase subunit 1